jgi:hypothetical protein
MTNPWNDALARKNAAHAAQATEWRVDLGELLDKIRGAGRAVGYDENANHRIDIGEVVLTGSEWELILRQRG